MPTLYVRSTDGDNKDDGNTWALAKATLAGAYAAASAGDTIYVSHVHAEESTAAGLSLTSPGTAASPCKVICVNDSTGALANTATVTTTGNYTIQIAAGFAYYYGISFISGLGGGSGGYLQVTNSSDNSYTFENCLFYQANTNSSAHLLVLGANDNDDNLYRFVNCTFRGSHVSQVIVIGFANVEIIGGSLNTTTAIPATLFYPSPGVPSTVFMTSFDCSGLTSSQALVRSNVKGQARFHISNCKFGVSEPPILSHTPTSPGSVRVYLDQCGSGDPSNGPRSEAYTYQGSVKTDTAVYRSGGASDGTSYSLKMTANASGVSFISPLVTRPIFKVDDTAGSEITVTAEIIQADGSTALDESECWMEVEYMGTSGSPITSFVTDHNSTIIALSTTDQTTSTETWTGLAGTPVKQKLSCAFTPAEKGYYMVRIYLARASAVVYVCPKLTVS